MPPDITLTSTLDHFSIGAAYYRAGRFVWVNQTLCQMLGYSEEVLLSIDPYSLLKPDEVQVVRDRSDKRHRGEEPTAVYRIHGKRQDGSWIPMETESRAVGPDGAALTLFRDLSSTRLAHELLEGLSELAAKVQRAPTPDAVYTASLEGLHALGFQACIARVEGDGYALRWKISDELAELAKPLLTPHLERGRSASIDACAHTLEPGYSEDAIESLRTNFTRLNLALPPERVARLRKCGLDKLAFAPLSIQGRALGVLITAADNLSRQTAAALTLFASQLASALEVTQNLVELQQKNRRLGAINSLATAGNESDPAELAQRLMRVVMDATASDSASIFRAGREALELETTVNVPEWFSQKYNRLPFASTVTGGAAASQRARTLMLDDWPKEHHEHLRRAGGLSSALLPLELKGKLSGLLVLSRNRAERYNDEDLSTAEVLADQVAIQLERARLVLALRASYDQLADAQKELVKRERLAALGELSAVIAHEVRNPLGVVYNSLGSLARMQIPNNARELLAIVSEESERLDRLVSDLLDFARPNEPRLAPESPALLVASTVEAARRGTALQGVEVHVDTPSGLPLVQVDNELCRQALLNLLLNAAQASGRQGEVVIRARYEAARQPPAVRLDVCDSGVGIAPEVADRIFQPFFTTRASGTGLGLALVKRIAEAHRAELAFDSHPGKGTTFSLWLPVAP